MSYQVTSLIACMLLLEVLTIFMNNDHSLKLKFVEHHRDSRQSGQYREDCPCVKGGQSTGVLKMQSEYMQKLCWQKICEADGPPVDRR